MLQVLVCFLFLCFLEYIYWLSPLTVRLNLFTSKLFAKGIYVFFPYHYLLRLIVLIIFVLFYDLTEWPPFSPVGYTGSLLFGIVLCQVLFGMALKSMLGIKVKEFNQLVRKWAAKDKKEFWLNILYLIFVVGLVEELIFRWFFVSSLWPALSWGVIIVVPLLNMIWHLPVWISSGFVSKNLFSMVFAAFVFSVVLTIISVATHNIIGAVLAHAFFDWIGTVGNKRAELQES